MELSILIYVLLLIAFAKALGEAVSRINQPPIVGELLAGIILGPFILGEVFSGLDNMYSSQFLSDLADLGILFLMLYVGMEFSPRNLMTSSWRGGAIAALGIVFPLGLGYYMSVLFGFSGSESVFIALAMSVTALPVTMRILKDMDVINTKTSETIVSAALMTDIALLFAMGIVLGGGEDATLADVLYLAVGFVMFFVLAYLIGRYVVPNLYRLLRRMQTGEAAFAVAIGIALVFAVVAERIGLPGFIGAFVAGILLRETGTGLRVWARVEDILSGVTIGFLAPIFFVLIGFTVDFNAVERNIPLLIAALLVAVVGKLAGSFIPARLLGLGGNESMAISSMMMGKGAMELVFARLAYEEGVISNEVFSVLVLVGFTSTFLAPVLFSYFFKRAECAGEIEPATGECLKGSGMDLPP